MDRREEKRAAAVGAADSVTSGELPRAHRSTPRPRLKWLRTLDAVYERSGSDDPRAWLNRFVAEKACRDHCLPSTISQLEKKGLAFERRDVEVLGFQGAPTRLTAYRLFSGSMARARELLGEPAGST